MKNILIITLVVIINIPALANDDDRRKKAFYAHTFGLDFGFNNYLQNDDFPGADNELYSVKPWGSWYVAITSNHITRLAGPLHLQFGADVSWYNFKFEDPSVRAENTPEGVIFHEVDISGINPVKSKLAASYINFSLVPTFYIGGRPHGSSGFNLLDFDQGNGFRIGAGGYAGYRLSDYTKFVFEDAGEREKEKANGNFYVNNWRYGIKVLLGVNDVDFFFNYDLNELFSEGRGPRLNAVSFGVRLL
ncbi:MAG: hypothetical protein ACOCXH_04840 [Cyclobacteriaceae bacterium]